MVARLAPLPIQQTDDLVTAVGPFERARGSNVTVVGCFREYIFPLATTPREVMIAHPSVQLTHLKIRPSLSARKVDGGTYHHNLSINVGQRSSGRDAVGWPGGAHSGRG
jgi:hypothetical protein